MHRSPWFVKNAASPARHCTHHSRQICLSPMFKVDSSVRIKLIRARSSSKPIRLELRGMCFKIQHCTIGQIKVRKQFKHNHSGSMMATSGTSQQENVTAIRLRILRCDDHRRAFGHSSNLRGSQKLATVTQVLPMERRFQNWQRIHSPECEGGANAQP